MTKHFLVLLLVVSGVVLVFWFPHLPATDDVPQQQLLQQQQDWKHSSSNHKRTTGGYYMPSVTDSYTRLRTIHKVGRSSLGRGNYIEKKDDSNMLMPILDDQQQEQSYDHSNDNNTKQAKPISKSTVPHKHAQISTETTTTIPKQGSAAVLTDKSAYYDSERIVVTYDDVTLNKICDGSTTKCWSALFPHDAMDYSQPQSTYATSQTPGYAYFAAQFLPAPVNARYKAVLAVADSYPLRVLGVSANFRILPNSATLDVDQSMYYEGQQIVVSYTLTCRMNMGSTWIALFAHNVSDYTHPPKTMQHYVVYHHDTATFSSRNLPALSTKYKAVMAVLDSNPLRILGVSQAFTVLPNSATLFTDDSQYIEGDLIDVTYTMIETGDNFDSDLASVALFADDVSDYVRSAAINLQMSNSYTTGIISISTLNLPDLNKKYRAVMAISGSNPLRILGVSNAFRVIPNTASLKTDATQYVDGDLITLVYTVNETVYHRKTPSFARAALFASNITDYSTRPAVEWDAYGFSSETGIVTFSSRFLPDVTTPYKAVVASTDDPLRIMAVSDPFYVLPNSATLTTDDSQYREGERINVTYTLKEAVTNLDSEFAQIALFPYNVTDYFTRPAARWNTYEVSHRSPTVTLSSTSLPVLSTKYKAVMATSSGSNPLRILGVSNAFYVLPNEAALTSDKTQYLEGERIDVTYTLKELVTNLDTNFAQIALFAYNVTDYSIPPAVEWNAYGVSRRSATVTFSSMSLPALSTKYKAVMASSGSDPRRILGISDVFQVLCNSATVATDKAQYLEGERINVTFTLKGAVYRDSDFAQIALFANNVTNYSMSPAARWRTYEVSRRSATVTLSSMRLPVLSTRYKAVMVVSGSNPLRILGVSDAFLVQPNSAALAFDKTQYLEGELIDITYTLNESATNLETNIVEVGLFQYDVTDYSICPAAYWNTDGASYRTGIVRFSSKKLPILSTKYKAVMVVAGSNPRRVLSVSDSFYVLPNSAALATDKNQYFESEVIHVTYTMNETAINLEAYFAYIALFQYDVTDYFSPPAARSHDPGALSNSGTVTFSSSDLPVLSIKYKAVMVVSGSKPRRVLGVSDPFHVHSESGPGGTRLNTLMDN